MMDILHFLPFCLGHQSYTVVNIPKKNLINVSFSFLFYKTNLHISQNRYTLLSNLLPQKSILRSYKYAEKRKITVKCISLSFSYKKCASCTK